MMVSVKEAVTAAFNFIENIYEGEEIADLSLEEVELSQDENYWLVTVGFTRTYSKPLEKVTVSPVFEPLSQTYVTNRDYKIVKIDANTGEPKSVKIRTI